MFGIFNKNKDTKKIIAEKVWDTGSCAAGTREIRLSVKTSSVDVKEKFPLLIIWRAKRMSALTAKKGILLAEASIPALRAK